MNEKEIEEITQKALKNTNCESGYPEVLAIKEALKLAEEKLKCPESGAPLCLCCEDKFKEEISHLKAENKELRRRIDEEIK